MQLRNYLSAKIHKATVTTANLNYVGSVTIDRELLEKTGMHVGEKVLIVNNTNGNRIDTYIIEGKAGSGCIEINGAAAHLMNEGDEVIIMAFTLSTEPMIAKAILVDHNNKFVRYLNEEQGQKA
ncbi:MAG TPA: aspartate 1-decarboxylase [Aeromonadales bacterium]|nr:aspartate 1-decarboxylase [Aeromonadales bacterium]